VVEKWGVGEGEGEGGGWTYRTTPTMIQVTELDDMPGFSQKSTPGWGWQSSRPRSMAAARRRRAVARERMGAAAAATAAASRGAFMPGMAVGWRFCGG
jgi:hypothetical protein